MCSYKIITMKLPRYALLYFFSLLFIIAPLSAQTLDDYWSDQFSLPGLPRTVHGISADPDGNIYAWVGGIYRWDGNDWQLLDIPLDTLEIDAEQIIVPTNFFSLEQEEMLAIGENATNPQEHIVVRWDGQKWNRLPKLPNATGISEPVVQGRNGEYVVSYYSEKTSTGYKPNIARWNGAVWENLLSKELGYITIIDASPEGNILARHQNYGLEEFDSILWWEGNGWHSVENTFVDDELYDLAIFEGRLYAVRQFQFQIGQKQAYHDAQFLMWNDTGWTPATGRLGTEYQLKRPRLLTEKRSGFDKNGVFYILTEQGIMRWKNGRWDPVSSTFMPQGIIVTDNGTLIGYNGESQAQTTLRGTGIAQYNSGQDTWSLLYHDKRGGLDRRAIQFGDGSWIGVSELSNFNPHIHVFIRQAIPHPDKGFYVAGQFDSAGGKFAQNIAWWDGDEWHSLGDTALFNFQIHSIATMGTQLYALGLHEERTPDHTSRSTILAVWDGTQWTTILDSVQINSGRLFVDGETLYINGNFDPIGTIAPAGIVRLDSQGWDDMNKGVKLANGRFFAHTRVHAMDKLNNDIYAGGAFRQRRQSSNL